MLVHLRLVVPPDLRHDVEDLLVHDDRVTNVTVVRDAAVRPAGDLVGADVAREAGDEIMRRLDELGLSRAGSVSVTVPEATPFAEADRADEAAAGDPDDGVLWEVVLAQARDAATGSWSFHLFLTLATALAAVAVLTDSPVLVVGAMVVGPDFGPVGALCAGIVTGRLALAGKALWLLVRGYVGAVAVVTLLALLGRACGVVTADQVGAARPLTSFIWQPNVWSVVVALIAGTVGALALTAEKSTTLVGVFIAVTTLPAAGNLAVALATGLGDESRGSLMQLGVNLLGMVIGGSATLGIQRLTHGGPVDDQGSAGLGHGRHTAPVQPDL